VVPLDRTGKALADRLAGDINLLADSKDGDADLVARLQLSELLGRNGKLLQYVTGFDASLGQMPGQRLVDARRTRRLPKATCTTE
jgi:hypothetical protein